MAGSKVKSSGSGSFAKGGSGKMFGKMGVAPKTPGTTGRSTGGFSKSAPKGGSGKMFGKMSANPMPPGQTGKSM